MYLEVEQQVKTSGSVYIGTCGIPWSPCHVFFKKFYRFVTGMNESAGVVETCGWRCGGRWGVGRQRRGVSGAVAGTDRCARAGRAPRAAAAADRWCWRARSRKRPPTAHLPRRGRRAAAARRRRTGRGEARRARPAAAAPRTTTRARRPARGQRARRGPGPSRDRNTRDVDSSTRARRHPGTYCGGVEAAGEATRVRARGHTATGAPLPRAHDRARTLFRERRSAPQPPPARRTLPILREIAGGR